MTRYGARACVLSNRCKASRCAAERSSVSIGPHAKPVLTPGQEVLQCSASSANHTCHRFSWLSRACSSSSRLWTAGAQKRTIPVVDIRWY